MWMHLQTILKITKSKILEISREIRLRFTSMEPRYRSKEISDQWFEEKRSKNDSD